MNTLHNLFCGGVALAAVAVAGGMTGSAHASYICDAPTQLSGATGHNPVVSTRIGIDNTTKQWWVVHTLRDGTQIHRDQQYTMNPLTGGWFGWGGAFSRNPKLWMAGYVSGVDRAADTLTYNEELHDSDKNNVVIMKSYALCHPRHDNDAPPPVEYHPSTSTVADDNVPFTMDNGAMMVKVDFPGYWARMQVDTGASMGTIAEGLAAKLIAEGHAHEEAETQQFKLANGSIITSHVIIVDSITVGSHTVNRVELSVSPDSANMLLGLPILNAIGKCTIDSTNHQLTFG